MKAILMSIQSKWLAQILSGDKTVELRKRFPKDYRGWVYLYCTKAIKGRPPLIRNAFGHFYTLDTWYVDGFQIVLSGKVVCRFWVNNVEDTIVINYDTQTQTLSEFELSVRSCVSIRYLNNYFVDCKAIDISKLEIFDKPKELSEFYYYKKRLIDCGMDCPPYFDEVKTQVRKAPQSWRYVES